MYDLVDAIMRRATWNLAESENYHHSIDTATRWHRGRNQVRLATEILAKMSASAHVCAEYMGKGARLTPDSPTLVNADYVYFDKWIERLKDGFKF